MSYSLVSNHCAFYSLRLIKKKKGHSNFKFQIEMFVVCQTNFHFTQNKFFFEFLVFQKFQFQFCFSLELISLIL